MKMGNFEKRLVNSPSHSQQVSQHAERLLNLIDVAAGQTYLDVGCGNGSAAIHLARKYQLKVTGIDVDPDQIRLAQKQSQSLTQVHFHTIDGTCLPFSDGTFDIVFTNKVTHHIPTWRAALTEMLRMVKHGGHFIYNDLVFPPPLAKAGEALVGNWFGFPTQREVETILQKQGFVSIHRTFSTVQFEGVFKRVG